MTSTTMSASTAPLEEIRALRGEIEHDQEQNERRWEAIDASASAIAAENVGRMENASRSVAAELGVVQLLFLLVVGVSSWNGEWTRGLVIAAGTTGAIVVWLLRRVLITRDVASSGNRRRTSG
jgi:hypothetical protein